MLRSIGKQSGESVESGLKPEVANTLYAEVFAQCDKLAAVEL